MKKSELRAHVAAIPVAVLGLAGALGVSGAVAQTVLPDTIVVANRVAEAAHRVPAAVSVIEREQIRASGATTVNEAIMRLLGVPGRLDLHGGGNYTLDLRGFGQTAGSNQVIVIDGLRLNEADLASPWLAGIPIESVERIEVLRGGASVMYGDAAVGGVIHITTRAGRGTARSNQGSVYLGFGSHNTLERRASATLASGGFSLDASAQRRDSDNHRDNFVSRSDGQSIGLQWAGQSVRVGVQHAEDDLRTGLPGGLSMAQFLANPRQTTTPNDTAAIANRRSSVFLEMAFDDWLLAFNHGVRSKHTRAVFGGSPWEPHVDARNSSLQASGQLDWEGAALAWVLGVETSEWNREVLGAWGSVADGHSTGWYGNLTADLPGGWRWDMGARTESLDRSTVSAGSALNRVQSRQQAFSLGASRDWGTGRTLWARAGSAYRMPNVDEIGFAAPGVLLRPQESVDLELGWRQRATNWNWNLTAYRSRLSDELGFDPTLPNPWGGLGANANFASTLRSGVEWDGVWRAQRQWELRANLAARSAKFRAGPHAGRQIALVPQHSAALGAVYRPDEQQRVLATLNWVGQSYADFNNTCAVPGHTTLDLAYARSWGQAEFTLGIRNLTDRRYFTSAFSCVAGEVGGIYPEAGRTLTAAVRLNF